MLHCVACNVAVPPWKEFCDECEEAIQGVYSSDHVYVRFMRNLHPYSIPENFLSITYDWAIDGNTEPW